MDDVKPWAGDQPQISDLYERARTCTVIRQCLSLYEHKKFDSLEQMLIACCLWLSKGNERAIQRIIDLEMRQTTRPQTFVSTPDGSSWAKSHFEPPARDANHE